MPAANLSIDCLDRRACEVRADPLKALLLLAQVTNQLHNVGLERLWQTMTDNAARMLRLTDYGLAVGCHADMVLFDARSTPEAILLQAPKLAVIKAGLRVAGLVRVAPHPLQ